MAMFPKNAHGHFLSSTADSWQKPRKTCRPFAVKKGLEKALLLSSFLGGLTACGRHQEAPSNPAITGGRNVGVSSSLPTRRSTLALTEPDLLAKGRSFCSAVLIAPKVAMTAAHCVTDQNGEPLDPSGMVVGSGTSLKATQEKSIPIVATAVHRRWRPGALELGDWTDFNDLALLYLDKTPENTRPVPLIHPKKPLKKGDRLSLAGYGVTSTRSIDDTGVLRSVLVRIADLEDDIHIFMTEGARRPGAALDPSGPEGRRKLHPIHAGACAGDSGGPAYRKREDGKTWEVVGITSFGTEMERVDGTPGEHYCTGSNGYTNLAPYAHYIEAASKALSEGRGCLGATFEFDEEGLKPLSRGICPSRSEFEK